MNVNYLNLNKHHQRMVEDQLMVGIRYKKDKLIESALEQDAYLLNLIENPKLSYIHKAIDNDGCALQFIPVNKRTPELCYRAVLNNPLALAYVKDQSESLCLMAVKRYARSIWFVKEPTRQIIDIAVKHYPDYIKYGSNFSNDSWRIALENDGMLIQYMQESKLTESLIMTAVKQNGMAIQYVPYAKQSYDIQSMAINQNGHALQFIKRPTLMMCEDAFRKTKSADVFRYAAANLTQYDKERLIANVRSDANAEACRKSTKKMGL